VIGTSATNSGLILTRLMLTSIVGSVVSGQLVSRLGRYKWIAIMGMLVTVAGSWMLVRLDVHSTNNDVLLAMLVMGLGMGFGMALYTLIVQNALPRKIGQATSTLVFFRSIGGTIGLAAMGSILTSTYLPAFKSALSEGLSKQPLPPAVKQSIQAQFLKIFSNPQILLSPDALAQMRAAAAAQGKQGLALLNVAIEAVKTGLAQGCRQLPKSYNYPLLSSAIRNGLMRSYRLARRRFSCYTPFHEDTCSLKEGICAIAVLTSP